MKRGTKKPYPVEKYLQRIKDFYAKHKRVPKYNEIEKGDATRRPLVRAFGSWDKAVQAALGKHAANIRWSKNDAKKIIVEKFVALGRHVVPEDFTTTELYGIGKCYGTFYSGVEDATNNSLRLEILRAIKELTQPGLGAPTHNEIFEQLRIKKIIIAEKQLTANLRAFVNSGYVQFGRYDKIGWWKITEAGNVLLLRR